MASPLTIITRRDETVDITAILDIAGQHQIERIIIGLPRSMNGSLGKQADKVNNFAEALKNRTEIPILFRDERLTTISAKRLMRDTGMKAKHDDAIAAAYILQEYLDEALTD